MRIVHVVRQYHPSYGGLEDFVRNLVSVQQRDGHAVSVVTLNTNFQNDQVLHAREVIDDVPVYRVSHIGSKRYPIAPSVRHYVTTADIVHVHAVDFFIDYLSLLKRFGMFKGKLILSTHGGIFHTQSFYRLKQLFFRSVTPFSLSQTDAVAASSYSDRDLFAPIVRNLEVVENGVRFRKFGDAEIDAAANGFLYVGRFSENKNLVNLVRWFAAAAASDDSLHLFIAGRTDGGNYDDVVAEIKRLHAESFITVISNPTDAEIQALIGRSRFALSASTYEGFGIAVVELMSYGLVPILSAIPSFRLFVNEAGIGELFELNESAFCTAIESAMRGYKATDKLVAQQFAQRYSWSAVAQKFDEIYRRETKVISREALVQAIDRARIINTSEERNRFVSEVLTDAGERRVVIDFLNQHAGNLLVRDKAFRQNFLASDLILRDGAGMRIALKLFGRDEGLNMNGTDLIPILVREFSRMHPDAPIFFFGTENPWLESGARALSRGHLGDVVLRDGFAPVSQYADALAPYKQHAKLIVLAMGMPKQEQVASTLRNTDTGPALIVCGGAILDFAADRFPRAPMWMRSNGLEWLFRLVNEPRRLFRRYVIGIPVFLAHVVWSRATTGSKQ